LNEVLALNAFISLVMAAELATEPPNNQTSDQRNDQPSMALLLYLDEFPDQDDDIVDLALICTNPSAQKNEQEAGLHAIVQCDSLPVPGKSDSALKTTSSEKTPHD
jgi:hypothetical protein